MERPTTSSGGRQWVAPVLPHMLTSSWAGGRSIRSYIEMIGLWARYIDDIFVVWNGPKEVFVKFVDQLNQNELGLHFNYDIQQWSFPFLDTD